MEPNGVGTDQLMFYYYCFVCTSKECSQTEQKITRVVQEITPAVQKTRTALIEKERVSDPLIGIFTRLSVCHLFVTFYWIFLFKT